MESKKGMNKMGEEMNDMQHNRENNVQIRRLATKMILCPSRSGIERAMARLIGTISLQRSHCSVSRHWSFVVAFDHCRKNLNLGESQVTQRVNDKISCSGGPNSTVMCKNACEEFCFFTPCQFYRISTFGVDSTSQGGKTSWYFHVFPFLFI